jgi:hypothetical protein
MQENDAGAAATTSTSTRANGARTVIRKASERVADRITLQSIEQSFPDFVETDGAFIKQLQELTLDHLNSGFAVGCCFWLVEGKLMVSCFKGRLGRPLHKQRARTLRRTRKRSRSSLCSCQQ